MDAEEVETFYHPLERLTGLVNIKLPAFRNYHSGCIVVVVKFISKHEYLGLFSAFDLTLKFVEIFESAEVIVK